MKLDHLYSLRNSFTVIGLTGRTGSGCTLLAETLSKDFINLEFSGLRDPQSFTDQTFARKYEICRDFLKYDSNWIPFEVIKYKDVLLFYILHKYGGNYNYIEDLLKKCYKQNIREANEVIVSELMQTISTFHVRHIKTIEKIKCLPPFKEIKSIDEFEKLNSIFFDESFKTLNRELLHILESKCFIRTRHLLHLASCNIRSTGDPADDSEPNIDKIYSIAELMNKIIRARHKFNQEQHKPTKIVIDSLRNSLEIMFFKERYSAFYMVATKDVLGNAKERLDERLKGQIPDDAERSVVVRKIMELDDTEYKTDDFSKGEFSSPDVENCIQKSDYHIFNLKKDQIDEFLQSLNELHSANGFLTREEQLMKLIGLIQQPGLITPSSAERCMQTANTAKLNSGCISRKVGAVITDAEYFIKAIGWNDVARGHTPCNLRSVTDYLHNAELLDTNKHYSDFEKGKVSNLSSFKYKGDNPGNFKDALIDYFQDSFNTKASDLNGKNCSFCFKSVHNHYEGEANQVHTRSLHAEENAMLQITKLGGVGTKGGFLFTTASPCELCSKKAYQLGVKTIFYIDPYPGISIDQIIKGGNDKDQPRLLPFSGAIGNAYHKLYEPFLSYKDEITMTLEIKPKKRIAKELSNVLGKINNEEIRAFISKTKEMNDKEIEELILSVIRNGQSKQ